MGIFSWFSSLYRKIKYVFDLVYTWLSPIYDDLVAISKKVKESNLEDDEARKAVFQEITDVLQSKGIKMSDSSLNLLIEVVYQLVKNGLA